MKALWTLVAILSIAAPVGAGIVDVIAGPYLDNDDSGKLSIGDVVPITIITVADLADVDLSLTVSGPGVLAESGGGVQYHEEFTLYNQSDPLVADNAITQIEGSTAAFIVAEGDPRAEIVWNLEIEVTGPRPITVDLSTGPGSYYTHPDTFMYTTLSNDDLGDLVISDALYAGVRVRVAGQGGSVAVVPQATSYPQGSVVNLTALPEAGYRVKKWRGAESTLLTTDNTLTVGRRNNVTVQFERIPEDSIKKVLFTAGGDAATPADGFAIMGALSADQGDFLQAEAIHVRLLNTDDEPIFAEALDTSDDAFSVPNSQLGFSYRGPGGGISRMNFKLAKGAFTLMGSGVDLTALSSPVTLEIAFGDYDHSFVLDETIINGPRRSIPMEYLKGIVDALVVNRVSGRVQPTTGLVTGSISGSLALEEVTVDLTDPTAEVLITINDYFETIAVPIGDFTASGQGHRYQYRRDRAVSAEDYTISRAQIDFDRNTFSIAVQNARITVHSDEVEFGISIIIDGQDVYDEVVTVSPGFAGGPTLLPAS